VIGFVPGLSLQCRLMSGTGRRYPHLGSTIAWQLMAAVSCLRTICQCWRFGRPETLTLDSRVGQRQAYQESFRTQHSSDQPLVQTLVQTLVHQKQLSSSHYVRQLRSARADHDL
jgi:hypothetical protein